MGINLTWNKTITIISKDASKRAIFSNCCWTQQTVRVANATTIVSKNITIVRIPGKTEFKTGDFVFLGETTDTLDARYLLQKYNAERPNGAIKIEILKDNNIGVLDHTRIEGS